MKLLNLIINGHKSNSRKASGGLTVEGGGGGFIIGCICCLQVDRPITGGVACVAGEGIWGRDRARAGKVGGEHLQGSRCFRHPAY